MVVVKYEFSRIFGQGFNSPQFHFAPMMEMVDIRDLKSLPSNGVRVRLSLGALFILWNLRCCYNSSRKGRYYFA